MLPVLTGDHRRRRNGRLLDAQMVPALTGVHRCRRHGQSKQSASKKRARRKFFDHFLPSSFKLNSSITFERLNYSTKREMKQVEVTTYLLRELG
jgi:hypothetical protein